MRMLTNYTSRGYNRATIREGLLDLLLSEIICVEHDEKTRLFIVSPWLRNIEFQVGGRGNLRLIPPYIPSRTSLFRLIELYLESGGGLTLVCLPPHKLVEQARINSVLRLHEVRDRLSAAGDIDASVYLSAEIDRITNEILIHRPMLDFIGKLHRRFKGKCSIVYNSELHAKICVGSKLALFGSANFTQRGVSKGDELSIIIGQNLA